MTRLSVFANTPRLFHSERVSMCAALVLLALLTTDALGQKGTWRERVSLVMRSVEDLNQQGELTSARLRDASSREWASSFYAYDKGRRCSATLIGPTALLLAAQCVPDGGEVVIEFRGLRTSATCTHAKSSPIVGRTADFALCLLWFPIEGIQFDTINLNPARIRNGTKVLMSSFSGCPAPSVDLPDEARFRISDGIVVALPDEHRREPNSIIVLGDSGVCPGDGGGAAYITLAPRRRLVVGVSYRFDYDKGEAYISSLSTQDGKAFLKRWTIEKTASICGVNYEGSNCR